MGTCIAVASYWIQLCGLEYRGLLQTQGVWNDDYAHDMISRRGNPAGAAGGAMSIVSPAGCRVRLSDDQRQSRQYGKQKAGEDHYR